VNAYGKRVETVSVTLELPVSAPLAATVRALEAARDAQSDGKAKQAMAALAALASRGLLEQLARSIKRRITFVETTANLTGYRALRFASGKWIEVAPARTAQQSFASGRLASNHHAIEQDACESCKGRLQRTL
jgi:hypothetical protein